MKLFILTLLTCICLKSFSQHYIQNYEGKIVKHQIVNIKNGAIIFVDTSVKNAEGLIDTLSLPMINIARFGLDSDYQKTTSKKYLSKTDLYHLSYEDANHMEIQAQKFFTATEILGSFSIGGFIIASFINEPIKPNKADYYYNNSNAYDIGKYQTDSSNYLTEINTYHVKANLTRVISGAFGAGAIICASTGVNNLLKSKRNKHLAEQISFIFAPTNLYIGYKF